MSKLSHLTLFIFTYKQCQSHVHGLVFLHMNSSWLCSYYLFGLMFMVLCYMGRSNNALFVFMVFIVVMFVIIKSVK